MTDVSHLQTVYDLFVISANSAAAVVVELIVVDEDYRAMLRRARLWHSMLSACPSVLDVQVP